MTKELQKTTTFLPLREQSKLRKEIKKFFRFFPHVRGYRPDFEDDLDAWLKGQTWTSLRLVEVFNKRLFIEWLARTLEQVRGLLRLLYDRYDVPPSAVLTLLAYFRIDSLSVDEVKSGKWIQPNHTPTYNWFCASDIVAIKFRSKTKVLKDAKALRSAARILEQWELPVLMHNDLFLNTYPHGFEVREVARTLEQLMRSRAHRPEGWQVKTYAKVLTEFFELTAKRPLYGYTGQLLKAGFRTKWNPAGDPREAAKKLAKAPLLPNEIPRISPLSLTYPFPLGSITWALRDAVFMCSVRGRVVIKAVRRE